MFRYDKTPNAAEKAKYYQGRLEFGDGRGERSWGPQVYFTNDLKDTKPVLVRVTEDNAGEDRGVYLRIS